MTPEDHAKLLQFASGLSRLPVGGFADLTPPFKLSLNLSLAPTSLPTAHTCFNNVGIPPYSSAADLRQKLMCAIYEGAGGFSFA